MDQLKSLGPQGLDWCFVGISAVAAYCVIDTCLLTAAATMIVLYVGYRVLRKNAINWLSSSGKYVLITGCDTGIGHRLAIYLDDLGFHVIATCLHGEGEGAQALKKLGSPRMHVVQLDVTSDENVAQCLKYVENRCGQTGLWGVVNNSGINTVGDIETTTINQYIMVNNINNFGVVRVTKAFLPLVRKVQGRVVNVSSVKGRFYLPSNAAYSMTKWAVENFTDTLRLEMKKFGIKAILMEPGHFGGCTGCLNKEGVARIRKEFDSQWKEASEDVKTMYGKDFLERQFKDVLSSSETSHSTLQPVMLAFKDALLNEYPQKRYLVDGANTLYDPYTLCARLNGFLPESIMDAIINYHFQGTPTAKTANKTS